MSGVETLEWHKNPFSKMEDASNPARSNPDAARGEDVDDGKRNQKSPEELQKEEQEARERFETAQRQGQEVRALEKKWDTAKQQMPTEWDLNLAFNDFPPKTGESETTQAKKVDGADGNVQTA
jgi:hypothetical protein